MRRSLREHTRTRQLLARREQNTKRSAQNTRRSAQNTRRSAQNRRRSGLLPNDNEAMGGANEARLAVPLTFSQAKRASHDTKGASHDTKGASHDTKGASHDAKGTPPDTNATSSTRRPLPSTIQGGWSPHRRGFARRNRDSRRMQHALFADELLVSGARFLNVLLLCASKTFQQSSLRFSGCRVAALQPHTLDGSSAFRLSNRRVM